LKGSLHEGLSSAPLRQEEWPTAKASRYNPASKGPVPPVFKRAGENAEEDVKSIS